MPHYPGSPRYGLELWNSIAGTLVVELLTFAIGIWIYVSTTRARDRIGHYAFFAYVVLLLIAYIGDRFSSPPSGTADIVWTGLIVEVILLPWARWLDHHRALRPGLGSGFPELRRRIATS